MSAYKRILEIDPSDVERMTVAARLFGLNIRKARGGQSNDYVIETNNLDDRKAIDRIVKGYATERAKEDAR